MNKRVLKWIYTHSRGSILIIFAMTVLSCGLSLISLKFVGVSKDVVNMATGVQEGDWFSSAMLLAGLLLLRLFVQISVNFLNVHGSSRMEIALKRHIFSILINKDYLSVTKYHSGELLNRLSSDISVIVNGVITILPSAALFLTSIIGAFIYLYFIDRFLAIIILALCPFVLIGAKLYSKRYKALHKECQEADGKTKSFMIEILQNLLVVKSFNNEKTVLNKSEDYQKRSYKLRVKRTKVSVVAHIAMYIFFQAGYYFALAYGAYRISTGAMNFGEFTAMLQLVGQIQSPFGNISTLVPQAFSVIASAERLIELENIADEPDTAMIDNPEKVYEDMEEIVFDNVSFSYNDDSSVSEISMRFKKGECVVIAGESGAGKSTAIKLLMNIFEPASGEIYIRTKNSKIPVTKATRPMFSYVPQGNLILSGTIRENIAFASANACDDEIIHAAKVAQIWDFISSLEEGLDTCIGEKGLGLSEGQAQRISIARAVLHGAPILLLDESTSALDSETETAFLKAIREMTDKTCIIISHKKAAFEIADHVETVLKRE